VVRATTILLVSTGLAACSVAGSTPKASPEAPSITAVVKSRFNDLIDLDNGDLVVAPPPTTARASVSEHQADAMFEATDAVQGPYEFAILGLGLVTVAPRVENSASTTTSPPDSAGSVPTTGPSNTTSLPSTTTAPTTSSTTSPTTSSTTSSTTTPGSTTTGPTTTTTGAGTAVAPPTQLPGYHDRLAWVGIVWGPTAACPAPTTTEAAPPRSTTYVAIVIDAHTGQRVIAYRSGGVSACTGATQTPSVTEPNELLSVPWQPVGPTSTAVQIQIPACGHYYGWTQVPTTGGGLADQVVVSVPFDPTCGATVSQTQAVDQVVPLGSGQALVDHAPVGPVQALQALPSD
jgi:hypothetical protein